MTHPHPALAALIAAFFVPVDGNAQERPEGQSVRIVGRSLPLRGRYTDGPRLSLPAPSALCVGKEGFWIACADGVRLAKPDGEIVRSLPRERLVAALCEGGDTLWLLERDLDPAGAFAIEVLDTATGRPIAQRRILPAPAHEGVVVNARGLCHTGDRLFVLQSDGVVLELDPETSRRVKAHATGSGHLHFLRAREADLVAASLAGFARIVLREDEPPEVTTFPLRARVAGLEWWRDHLWLLEREGGEGEARIIRFLPPSELRIRILARGEQRRTNPAVAWKVGEESFEDAAALKRHLGDLHRRKVRWQQDEGGRLQPPALVIEPGEGVTYGAVATTIDILRDAGYRDIVFAAGLGARKAK